MNCLAQLWQFSPCGDECQLRLKKREENTEVISLSIAQTYREGIKGGGAYPGCSNALRYASELRFPAVIQTPEKDTGMFLKLLAQIKLLLNFEIIAMKRTTNSLKLLPDLAILSGYQHSPVRRGFNALWENN